MTGIKRTEALLDRVVKRLPGGGEPRAGQLEMALRVAASIESSRHLVVRAGTGTGKSLAYLAAGVASGKRVLVATATKALQHQLVSKDLPVIEAASPRPIRFALLKGRSNYLCAQRLVESRMAGDQGELDDERSLSEQTSARGAMVTAILEWASSTDTGDSAELDFEPDPAVWRSFSVTADECPGAQRCPSGGECFAERARTEAAEADVVVVNLHLLGAHLASGGMVLPPAELVVIDEAHEAEEIFSRSLGASISPGRMRGVAASARAAAGRRTTSATGETALALADVATELEVALSSREGKRVDLARDSELERVIELSSSRAERLERSLREATGGGEGGDSRLQRSLQACSGLRRDLAMLFSLSEDQVAWVSSGARPSLEIAPLDVAKVLSDSLFADTPVVLTSATILLDEGTRLGAQVERTDAIDVGSPFDYERQGLLYCAAHLPDRRRSGAESAIAEEVVALLSAAGGRALVLFTSWAAMRAVAGEVRARIELPVLLQGERSKGALVEELTQTPELSVFATMGFWQGVDIPGASLSLVIIDRIPFARPDDPLTQARRERAGARAFATIDLPHAANLLAQGAGRLIRTGTDRGVVAVLDSRLATASYRWQLVRALPPMRRTRSRAEAEEFLRSIDEQERAARISSRGAR